jgi:predicted nuclease of predicted toxin-antitoxin system
LRRRGVDVTTSQEAALLEATDERQVAFALAEKRTLVTHDEDFLALAARIPHAGVAYCHAQSRSVGQIIASLLLIRDCLTADDMRDHVEYL